MRVRTKAVTAIAVLVLAGFVYWGRAVVRRGFSAREEPSRLERLIARRVREIAIPADAKQSGNPYPITSDSLKAACGHWLDHCALCHAADGSGSAAIGRNLYPKAPDLREPETQRLSDGELYYIISNGIRFTGMPAWGEQDSPEAIWQLVAFIRQLPHRSPESLQQTEEASTPQAEAMAYADHLHPADTADQKHPC